MAKNTNFTENVAYGGAMPRYKVFHSSKAQYLFIWWNKFVMDNFYREKTAVTAIFTLNCGIYVFFGLENSGPSY
jgi:hypothetical protein